MTWPPKEMFAISRIGQAYDVYCSQCLTVKPRRCSTDKLKRPQSFHWPWRTFLWEFLPYHLFYLFTLEGFVRTRLLISMTKGSFFPLMRWSRTTPVSDECEKNIESKTWLDSKILINICGFISTTVIFASLFSLFFASVDRFSFRVFNRHRK